MKKLNVTKSLMLFLVISIICSTVIFLFPVQQMNQTVTLSFNINANLADTYQSFYGDSDDFREENSEKKEYNQVGSEEKLVFSIPATTRYLRLDLGNQPGKIIIDDLKVSFFWAKLPISVNDITQSSGLESIQKINDEIQVISNSNDPHIMIALDNTGLDRLNFLTQNITQFIKIFVIAIFNVVLLLFFKSLRSLKGLALELIDNRELIWNLANNDFKTKYAGSYLGIIWAFVQPIITVLIYWFVFQVGFRSGSVQDVPFILWLVTGMVPWFFFSDALLNATNSMLEYSYLVKKVVFKISILPIVKIFSALFVHTFFVGFILLLFLGYGYQPTIYSIQVIYYSTCVFLLVLGLSYATSAIIVFFKDLGQIIGILIQMGMWMTPIMWSYTMIPTKYQWLLKINPMYYIIEGYRDALISHVWFWERYNQTVYFWIVTSILFIIGATVFKKLKKHFADVL